MTQQAAIKAKDTFKTDHWAKEPDKYNVIGIGVDEIFDLDTEEVFHEEYYVAVYMFDINDAKDLPIVIDGISIRYFPVIPVEVEEK